MGNGIDARTIEYGAAVVLEHQMEVNGTHLECSKCETIFKVGTIDTESEECPTCPICSSDEFYELTMEE